MQLASQQEISNLRGFIEEDKFRMERIEEQMNDITELNQHEVTNLKQVGWRARGIGREWKDGRCVWEKGLGVKSG